MSLKSVNTALTPPVSCSSLVRDLLRAGPRHHRADFGLPSWPSGDGDGFLILKGIRDVVTGLILGVLLPTGQGRPLGWVLLVGALIPVGDMTTVLAHHGSTAAAFGIHGLTAALMVVTGLLILRETRTVTAAPVPAAGR
jgi:hypothetical protein